MALSKPKRRIGGKKKKREKENKGTKETNKIISGSFVNEIFKLEYNTIYDLKCLYCLNEKKKKKKRNAFSA
jgi:hypothetical protein